MTIEAINNLSQKYGKDKNELNKMYLEATMAEKEKGFEDGPAAKRALRLVELTLKKESISTPTDDLNVIIIGTKEGFDGSNEDRVAALKQWEENPQKAIAEGWTDEQGTPLDRKPNFGDPKNPNKNYGKPLRASWIRPLTCYNMDTKKPFNFMLKWKQAKELEVPLFQEVIINGTAKKNSDNYNGAKSTHIIPKGEGQVDFCALIKKFKALKALMIDIGDLGEWVEQHGNKDVFLAEADVLEIDMTPNSTGSRTLILDNDQDYGQRVFVPEIVPIKFGEMSRIIIVGSAKKGKGNYGPTATAMGLYAIPEFLFEPENTGSWKDTPVPKTEKESEEEEEKPVSKPSPKSPHQAASPKPAGELKTATPMMILRVVIVNDGNITREELNTQAQANGFDLDSIPTALEILIEDGSILEQNDGNGVVYTVVE